MKYKKGSIVEVFFKNDICYHSWRCAEILSGDGRNYTVSYDVYPGFTNKDDLENVSVKLIRPSPPVMEISESWVPGDVVEVFHTLLWKMAIVTKDCSRDQFLVRLVGSSQEFEVNKSELRVRQTYKNGEWIIIDKVPRDYKNCQNPGSQAKRRDSNRDFCYKDVFFDAENSQRMFESCIASSKDLKRGSHDFYSQNEANEVCGQKFQKSEDESKCLRVLETSCHSRLERNDTASVSSSISSCGSNSNKPYKMRNVAGPVEDFEGHESDAESTCKLGYQKVNKRSRAKTALRNDIHRQELNAYRCTMKALHAAGPLTWENEEMVTNLRMSLHISNDEHLTILKLLKFCS
ncbi:uncharacterized protein [Rutidosis leptorrhynchoides]|uniref:uncharacterized protein n=1 Tax=Rutidosis leptorrhynchoides TaxID=125765 RepID=UPI003A993BFF